MSVLTGADSVQDVFGGALSEIANSNMPSGGSPQNQNIDFLPGLVRTRGGLQVKQNYSSIAGGPWGVRYAKGYAVVPESETTIALLWNASSGAGKVAAGTTPIGSVYGYGNTIPWNPTLTDAGWGGPLARSVTQFSREYIAISQGRYGWDIPRQWDGTNFDRVSMCGPGATGTVSNFLPPAAAIASSGTGTAVNLTASPTGAVRGGLQSFHYRYYIPGRGWVTTNVTYDTIVTFTTTTSHGLSANQQFTIAGCSPTDFNQTFTVLNVLSTTQVTAASTSPKLGETGGGGTLTPSPNTVQRLNGVITVNTATAHNFQPGWSVTISAVADIAVGSGISSISQVNGVATCVTAAAHGLVPGSLVDISGTQNYNNPSGQPYIVVSVPSVTTFTFVFLFNVPSESAGTVSSVFDGTYTIAQTPNANSFTYASAGPNLGQTPSAGVATVVGNVVAGAHQVAVSFILRSGYITRPSPPVTVFAIGGELLQISNLPTGPANVVGRLIMATQIIEPPATTSDFFSIRGPNIAQGNNFQINDNTTTNVVLDFTDSSLDTSESVDYLFDLVELGPCASFAAYSGRIFAIGELNMVGDLQNLPFNGGWTPSSVANFPANGADGGGGHAWTNPNNIGSTSSSASIAGTGSVFTSNPLNGTQFGFAVSAAPTGIQVTVNTSGVSGGSTLDQINVQLLKAGVPVGNIKSQYMTRFVNSYSFGGAGDLWGATWLASDVNATTWGVQITIVVGNGTGTIQLNAESATIFQPVSVPLGWISDATNGAGGSAVIGGGVFGDAYQINATAGEGMITQGIYADAFGDPILTPLQKYGARVTGYATSLSANVVVEFYSPSQGSIALATVSGFGTSFETEIAGMSASLPSSIPTDMILRVYSGAGIGTVTIDRVELYLVATPINTTVVRASRFQDPESFDGVLGLIQPVYANGESVRALYTLRDSLYLVCDRSTYVTKDTGGEPATWTVDIVSDAIGCCGPSAVAKGEDWTVKANRYGLYLYLGREPQKISHEIQSFWNQINWSYAGKVWVAVDPNVRRVYIGAPVNGATEVNQIFVMAYETQDTSQEIGDYGTLRFSVYSGRRLVLEQGRKWTIWNFQTPGASPQTLFAPCGNLVEQSDGTAELLIGGGADSNLYFIDPTNRGNDNGAAVLSSYTTNFFPTYEEEQGLQGDDGRRLRSHIHTYSFLRHNTIGNGVMQVNLFDGTLSSVLNNPRPVGSFSLSSSRYNGDDESEQTEVDSERWALQFLTNGVGSWFQVERTVRVVEQGATLIRGATPS